MLGLSYYCGFGFTSGTNSITIFAALVPAHEFFFEHISRNNNATPHKFI